MVPVQGHLDGLLLAILAKEPAHGYAVIEELHRRSQGEFDLPEGTVYPALHRLEHDRLLASRWVRQDGRRRRVYEITRRGRTVLGQQRKTWRSFSRAVESIYGSVG